MNKSITVITEEIGEWAKHNFDYHAPQLGVAEEIGETAHSILKQRQKIRKGASPEEAMAALKDAIGDAAIYALHLFYKINHEGTKIASPKAGSVDETLAVLFLTVGRLMLQPWSSVEFGSLWMNLNLLAELNGWKLDEIVNEVWAEVGKRDWRKYPKTGFPPQ